ncbi:hypothetical protein [Serratia sp. M24T3]|uniref:hypothetical protein n=1 Tax=Serratia sp. M24T3 TaxID=932213 RepID=UPI00025B9618|nr:hypothetical protein [Serratia sp. M24T3]EIC84427.1 hypothetical protein SPM24T3_12114 [Serratia sp. M24T3]
MTFALAAHRDETAAVSDEDLSGKGAQDIVIWGNKGAEHGLIDRQKKARTEVRAEQTGLSERVFLYFFWGITETSVDLIAHKIVIKM